MNIFMDTVRDATTKFPIAAAEVQVFVPGTLNHVPLYADPFGTTDLPQPVITNGNGDFAFFITGGTYDMVTDQGEFTDSPAQIVVYDRTRATYDVTEKHPVPDFDIYADGWNDDYEAMQRLLEVAYNGGWGGTVVIPKGYIVCVSGTLTPPRNVTITGGGEIRKIGSDAGALISIVAQNVVLDNIVLTGVEDQTLRTTDPWAVPVSLVGNVYVATGTGVNGSGVLVYSWLASGAVIKNCTIKDFSGANIRILGEEVADVVIENNKILGARKDGILIERGKGHVIRGNLIEDSVGTGIYLRPTTAGHEIRNVVIDDNKIITHRGITNKYPWAWGWHPYYQSGTYDNYTVGHGIVITSYWDQTSGSIGNPQGIVNNIQVTNNWVEIQAPTTDREEGAGVDEWDRVNSCALAVGVSYGIISVPADLTVKGNTFKTNISSHNGYLPHGLMDVRYRCKLHSQGNTILSQAGPNNAFSIHSGIELVSWWSNSPTNYSGMPCITVKDHIAGPFRYGVVGRGLNGFEIDCVVHNLGENSVDGAALGLVGCNSPSMGPRNGTVRGTYMGGRSAMRLGNMKNVTFDNCTFIIDTTSGNSEIIELYGPNAGSVLEGVNFLNCTVNKLSAYTAPFATATGGQYAYPVSGSFLWHVDAGTTHNIYNRNFERTEGWIILATNTTVPASTVTATVSAARNLAFVSAASADNDVIQWVAIPMSTGDRNNNADEIRVKNGDKTYVGILPSGSGDWAADIEPGVTAGWAAYWAEISYEAGAGAPAWAAANEYAVKPCTHVTSGGLYYICIQDNGPWTVAGAIVPGVTAGWASYWKAVTKVSAVAYSATNNYWAYPMLRFLGPGPVRLNMSVAEAALAGNPGTLNDCWEVGTRYTSQAYIALEE